MTEKEFLKSIEGLRSKNDTIVADTLDLIELQGDHRHIVPMCELLDNQIDTFVSQRIFDILYSLKIQSAVPELIKAIKSSSEILTKRKLLTACWSSGLDFSAELPDICRIFMSSDFETAFEAYTLIETTDTANINQVIANECYLIISSDNRSLNIHKIPLHTQLNQMFTAISS